jgi:dihydroorotate dehydrogenase
MSGLFEKLIRPALFRLPPEIAHELGIDALRFGLGSGAARSVANRIYAPTFEFGPVERFGLKFANPLGIAAGFDKNGVVVDQLAAIGFGFTEVGTVTLRPQPGNKKPRLFRLPADNALINRFGFNNDGAEKIAARLRASRRQCLIGVNIGKNRDVPIEFAVENYLACFRVVYGCADYIAVNVSSPNTPNLRELQRSENLEELLFGLQNLNRELSAGGTPKPLLVKIAPDLTDAGIEEAADVARRAGLAGIIATNTTISRDGLKTTIEEHGGLSGRPLAARSNEVIRRLFRATGGTLPIIGVGGIFNAADAFEKIAAGASLIQAYTGFVYEGPGFAHAVVSGLSAALKERGFAKFDDAVGSSVK